MDIAALREQLHQYINTADERHLSAILTLVGNKHDDDNEERYDDKTLDILEQRMEKHKQGISRSFTVEESIEWVKQHK